MPKVYVVQQAPGRNLTAAFQFGELEVLVDEGFTVYSPAPIARMIERKLRNISSDDYLLPMGDPIAIGLAMHIALRLLNSRVKVLKWDRQKQTYFPVTIDLRTGG